METEHARSMRNEKVEKLSVPPGFVSLSSFTLKRVLSSEVASSSMAVGDVCETERSQMVFTPGIDDIEKFKSNLGHRPWILYDQLNFHPNESDSELEVVIIFFFSCFSIDTLLKSKVIAALCCM